MITGPETNLTEAEFQHIARTIGTLAAEPPITVKASDGIPVFEILERTA